MSGYTKLSHSLVTSTVWQESAPTRCVWITMLAIADQHGEVQASVPGLAKLAGVTVAECETALDIFTKPDKYSRTPDFEGRRIEAIAGGWVLLNHKKYRHLYSADERREHTAERTRLWRERHKASQGVTGDARDGKQKQIQKQKQEKPKDIPPDGGSSRTTWLTPYAVVWDAKFGAASFPFGQAAKYLKPVEEALGPDETARRLTRFVAEAEAKFVSLARFAQTHGQYAEGVVSAADAELEAIAAEARPEAYVNAEAVKAWIARQGAGNTPTQISPFGARSGLETAFPAPHGASQ